MEEEPKEELKCEECGMPMDFSYSERRALCEYCYKEMLMEDEDWINYQDWQDAEWEAKQAAQH